MTWNDLEIGDEFKKFGIEGKIVEKIKSIRGDYVKTIKIERENKEFVYVSIGGK